MEGVEEAAVAVARVCHFALDVFTVMQHGLPGELVDVEAVLSAAASDLENDQVMMQAAAALEAEVTGSAPFEDEAVTLSEEYFAQYFVGDTVNLGALSKAVNVSHEFLASYVFEHGFGNRLQKFKRLRLPRRVGVVGWRPVPNTSDEDVFFGELKRACCSSLRQARQARSQVWVSSFERQFVPCMSPSHRVHLVTDLFDRLSSSQSTQGTRGYMNSCGSVHVRSFGDVHVNSRGEVEHRNSFNLHAEPRGVNKGVEYEYSAWCWASCCREACCSTAGAWKGQAFCKTRTCSFPWKRKSCRSVLLWWLVLHVLITLLCHLGQAESFGTCWVGHSWRKQIGLVYGCSVVPSKGRIFFLPLTQQETG